jgi:hypothetical protein
VVVALLLCTTVASAACSPGPGGKPAPNGYACTPTACDDHVVFYAFANLSGTPWQVQSTVYVNQMTCDATCRASGGNTPGYILNFLELADFSSANRYFIRMGYGTNNQSGIGSYFVDYYLPEKTYTIDNWGFTDQSNPNLMRPPFFTQFEILAWTGDGTCTHTRWTALFTPTFSDGLATDTLCTTFTPDVWMMGQILVGKSGATAGTAYFSQNLYSTAPSPRGYRDPITPLEPTNASYLTSDGSSVSTGQPPYAGWDPKPVAPNTEGGTFWTECCQPPP